MNPGRSKPGRRHWSQSPRSSPAESPKRSPHPTAPPTENPTRWYRQSRLPSRSRPRVSQPASSAAAAIRLKSLIRMSTSPCRSILNSLRHAPIDCCRHAYPRVPLTERRRRIHSNPGPVSIVSVHGIRGDHAGSDASTGVISSRSLSRSSRWSRAAGEAPPLLASPGLLEVDQHGRSAPRSGLPPNILWLEGVHPSRPAS